MDVADWPPSRTARLVGRQREQDILRQHLDAAINGHGNLVLISGEAGIGKTTLVEHLGREAEAAGCLIQWGHAYDLTTTPPYGPWIELARRYQATGREPAFPSFIDDSEALAELGSQERLLREVSTFFTGLADQQPLVLVLDDLHWADQASLDLLRVLARDVRAHALLLVVTYRSDELNRRHPLFALVPLLIRESGAERLDVRPLDDVALRSLIWQRYRLGTEAVTRLGSYLRAHAEGNPLYALELVRALEAEGILSEVNGTWQLGDLERMRLPPLLRQVIEGRLGRLSQETRELLQMAAVIGQEVPLELWQQVSGATDEALVSAIEQGQTTQVIDEVTGSRYRFHHALIREALYEEVVALRRRIWHRAVGDVLSATANPDPDAVAYHFQQAGDERAIEWLLRAAERAGHAYAIRAAVKRLELVIALYQDHGRTPRDYYRLLFAIGSLLRFIWDPQAIAYLVEAAAAARESGDLMLAALADAERGFGRWSSGEYRDGMAVLQRAVDDALRVLTRDPGVLKQTIRLFGKLYSLDGIDSLEEVLARRASIRVFMLSQLGPLHEALQLAAPFAETIGQAMRDGAALPEFLWNGAVPYSTENLTHGLSCAFAALGQTEQAHRFFEAAKRLYGSKPDVGLITYHELNLLHLPYEADRLNERHRLVEAARESISRGADFDQLSWRSEHVAMRELLLLLLEARWPQAREIAEIARHASRVASFRETATPILATLAFEQGDTPLAIRIIADLLPRGPATEPGDTTFDTALRLQRLAARVALDTGDLPAARSWLETHDRWLAWSGSVLGRAEGALGWTAYHRANDDTALARQHADLALVHASNPRQPVALIAVQRVLGQLDTAERHYEDATEHLQQSLDLADACAAPFERALTMIALGVLRMAERRPDDARELLSEARGICEPLEARPTLSRIAALETELEALKPGRRTRYPAGLTAREVDVLRLVSEGLSDVETAERLFLSPRTINTHLTAIYTKLNVNSRTAATRFAVEQGLV